MTETLIGIVFFVNTVVIVLAQLPIASLSEGHRRMRARRSSACSGRAAGSLVPLAGVDDRSGGELVLPWRS